MRARAVAAASLVLALAGPARADDRARAEVYFRAGERAYGAQNFAAAAADFEEAYKSLPLPEIAFSAAQAYRREYRIDPRPEYVVRAVTLYRAYLDKVKRGGRVADASDALDEMQRELDHLIKEGVKVSAELAAEHTQLGVNVTLGGVVAPSGALHEVEDKEPAPAGDVQVTLDGKPVAPFALIGVAPGKHVFHVEAPGFFARDKQAVAVQGNSQMIDVTLDPKPGRIAVTTEAGAKIQVDGRAYGRAPRGAIEVHAGRHLVAIVHRGREPVARELEVGNDELVTVDAPLAITQRRRAVPWVLGGAGVLAVASGGTTLLAYLAERDALAIRDRRLGTGNLGPDDVRAYDAARHHRDELAAAAWITGGAALAAAAVGAGLYWFDERDAGSARVEPIVSPAGAGAQVRGQF